MKDNYCKFAKVFQSSYGGCVGYDGIITETIECSKTEEITGKCSTCYFPKCDDYVEYTVLERILRFLFGVLITIIVAPLFLWIILALIYFL